MKALGKGSLASLIKVAVSILSVILWGALALLLTAALVTLALWSGLEAGWLHAFALDGEIAFEASGVQIHAEGGAIAAWPLVLSALAAGLLGVIGALVVVGRLRRLFENFTSNEPFNRANADHLRIIWIAMLAMELSKYAVAHLFGWVLVRYGAPDEVGIDVNPSVDVSTWAAILILIVLAEVFREGARLREDQELTI